MQKVKNYSILILTVFVLILAWQWSSMKDSRDKERADKERWQSNYMEATKTARENKDIALTLKEFIKLKDDRISRLLDSLNIKPKIVTKYEIQTIIQHDTTIKEVEVFKIGAGTYNITDSGPCFVWSGKVSILSEDSLKVARNRFEYNNTVEDLYYRKQKGRFLFWKTYYKDKVDHVSVPKCGVSSTNTIDILR